MADQQTSNIRIFGEYVTVAEPNESVENILKRVKENHEKMMSDAKNGKTIPLSEPIHVKKGQVALIGNGGIIL